MHLVASSDLIFVRRRTIYIEIVFPITSQLQFYQFRAAQYTWTLNTSVVRWNRSLTTIPSQIFETCQISFILFRGGK